MVRNLKLDEIAKHTHPPRVDYNGSDHIMKRTWRASKEKASIESLARRSFSSFFHPRSHIALKLPRRRKRAASVMDVSLLRTVRGNAFGKTHEKHPHPNGGHVCQRSSLDGLDWVLTSLPSTTLKKFNQLYHTISCELVRDVRRCGPSS